MSARAHLQHEALIAKRMGARSFTSLPPSLPRRAQWRDNSQIAQNGHSHCLFENSRGRGRERGKGARDGWKLLIRLEMSDIAYLKADVLISRRMGGNALSLAQWSKAPRLCFYQLVLFCRAEVSSWMNNMGAKPPPLFCLKWPWDLSNQTTNHCNSNDPPWVFKSMQTLGLVTSNLLNSASKTLDHSIKSLKPSLQFNNNNSPKPEKLTTAKKKPLSPAEQAEAEQRAFACALASGKEATVLEFYSPNCRLCSSMMGFVEEVEKRHSEWLSIVLADAENDQWLPELLHYDIRYVPCFVLLDKQGRALAKTAVPNSRMHVVAGLSHLLKIKQSQRNKQKVAP